MASSIIDTAVIVPARVASTRLKRKPLQMIGDKTMIEHVLQQTKKLNIPGIFIATDSDEISSLVISKGGNAIMTSDDPITGTDRVFEAFKKIPNYERIKYVVNLQGDMPFIDCSIVSKITQALKNSEFDIMTAVTKVERDIAISESNVTAVVDKNNKALYFSRSLIPSGGDEFLYHIGIYGFRADALEKFVSLDQTKNEKSENLEQLRALDNGMTIGVCYCNEVPISVDTAEDLDRARVFLANNP